MQISSIHFEETRTHRIKMQKIATAQDSLMFSGMCGNLFTYYLVLLLLCCIAEYVSGLYYDRDDYKIYTCTLSRPCSIDLSSHVKGDRQ
jgi:hypothetical protein